MKETSKTRPARQAGYTLIELMTVFALFAILAVIAFPILGSAIQRTRLANAMELVTMEMRQARQAAVDYRRLFRFTVDQGQEVLRLERQTNPGGPWDLVKTQFLPENVDFAVPVGAPTGEGSPDGMGETAVQLGDSNYVIFHPDGSGRNEINERINGIVYVSSTEFEDEGRAVTLIGSTGRIKSWKLVEEDGVKKWK